MGYREDKNYLEKQKEFRNILKENAIKKEKERYNNRIIALEDAKMLREMSIKKFYDYKDNVKKTLLKKALMEICTGSLLYPSDREINICENLIDQYIGETGSHVLLRNMRLSKNYLLRSIAEEVNNSFKKITENAVAEDDSSQTIPEENVEEFWDNVDKANDVKDITNIIRLRVSNAEEEFVNKNQEDKNNINDILKKTASRIQLAQDTNDNDYSEAVEESETRLAKEDIYKIQHVNHRNVFDKMVRTLSEAVLKNEDARDTFVENGHLKMESIIESVRCMYTLLEMTATIKLENVDEKYIEETINSIK